MALETKKAKISEVIFAEASFLCNAWAAGEMMGNEGLVK